MTDDEVMKKDQEWFEKAKQEGRLKENPTEDHKAGLRTMQNPVRRNILKSLGESKMSFDDIKAEFKLNDMQAKLHLGMLEDTLYIEKEDDSIYIITPRGEAFLVNVEPKHL